MVTGKNSAWVIARLTKGGWQYYCGAAARNSISSRRGDAYHYSTYGDALAAAQQHSLLKDSDCWRIRKADRAAALSRVAG